MAPPPAYGYTYQHQVPQPPAPIRSRASWWFAVIRPWAIVVPIVTIIMDIWWYSTGRLCADNAPTSDECFWILWLSLPLAIVSLVWNLATTISARRAAHYRAGIAIGIQLPVQSLIAVGATICLALLAWHFAMYMNRIYDSHLEGAMIAFVSIITLVNWLLAGCTAYDWNLVRRRDRQQQESYVL